MAVCEGRAVFVAVGLTLLTGAGAVGVLPAQALSNNRTEIKICLSKGGGPDECLFNIAYIQVNLPVASQVLGLVKQEHAGA